MLSLRWSVALCVSWRWIAFRTSHARAVTPPCRARSDRPGVYHVAPEGRMNDLYDEDILTWSEQQAELLRRRSANALDWDHLAEEIEDVGRSQLRAVESHLIQAVLHDLKAEAWPLSRDVAHWRAEARGQRDDARGAFTP